MCHTRFSLSGCIYGIDHQTKIQIDCKIQLPVILPCNHVHCVNTTDRNTYIITIIARTMHKSFHTLSIAIQLWGFTKIKKILES